VASDEDPSSSDGFADDLVVLISRLHAVDTQGKRFSGAGRGGVLTDQDSWLEDCLRRSSGLLDVTTARKTLDRLRTVPRTGDDVHVTH